MTQATGRQPMLTRRRHQTGRARRSADAGGVKASHRHSQAEGAGRVENAEVARILRDTADLLAVQGAISFRIQAYRNAARTIEELAEPVQAYMESTGKKLTDLPGIGADLAGKIAEIARTGTLPLQQELEDKTPKGAASLLQVRGIGPRRAVLLAERLGIRSVEDLRKAAQGGKLAPVVGERMQQSILRELAAQHFEERRILRPKAAEYGEQVAAYLKQMPEIQRCEIAGSFRRARETIGDLDILASTNAPDAVIDYFVAYPKASAVLEKGDTKASVRLHSGLRVDLRVLKDESFGAALHYFTGSKAHNIAIRRMGQAHHLKINEYGVFRGRRRIGGETEMEIFKAVGLPWIPPEIREANGEIEAAARGKLPKLVTRKDIRGDLQMHTTDTDGRDTIEDMARAAEALGYEYIAITDHSQAVRVVGGLDAAAFRRQWKKIDRLNKKLRHLTVLRGVEVDILKDGTLDLDDATLAGFDIVLASIHSYFELSAKEQTARVLKALDHPSVDVFAHPFGRQIGRRAPVDFNLEAVVRTAVDNGVLLEVNGQPDRLDLDDASCRRAMEMGARIVIDTDAHRTTELEFMRWGVDQARRGWADVKRVANAKPLDRFLRELRRSKR